MKKLIGSLIALGGALAFAEGLTTVDDFSGTAANADFWDTSSHPARTVNVRTVAIPFDLGVAPQQSATLGTFDSRLGTEATGTFAGRFSTRPAGVIVNFR